jgi:hypothetical protein
MGHLAEAHGGRGAPGRKVTLPVRPLVALALENAVEGCVREAYGGWVATYQGEVAAWAHDRLTEEERARVALALDDAVDEWMTALEDEPARDVVREAGVPTATVAKALLREMRQGLRAYAA